MTQQTKIKDFTSGNITKQLTFFALPLLASNLLQIVYNMVDMVVVGHVMGKVGLSAVSVGGDVSGFLTFVAMGFSAAGQVILSQYIGAGQSEKIARFVNTMFMFLMLCALVISVVCLFLREPILHLMNAPKEAFSEALSYSTISIAGLIFIYGYNMVSAVLRGMGDSKNPFIFISIAAILNLVLDIVFVAGMDMGAGGAALATVISQGVSFVSCLVLLIRNKEQYALDFRKFWIMDKKMLSALVKLGTPMAIKSASIHFSKLFVNSWINSYGVAVSAFAGIANKFSSISNLLSNALNTAGSSMVGQNIAARKYKRVISIVLNIFAITFTTAFILSVVVCVFPMQIFGLFTGEASVLTLVNEYLPVVVLLFFGSAARSGMNALLNGSGNYKVNFATAIFDGIIMRIGLAALFGLVLDMKYLGFWLGDALAGFTPFVIGLVFYFTGIWKKGKAVIQ